MVAVRRLKGATLPLAGALAALVLFAGCRFAREIVNSHVRDIDTSWIEPGRTTRTDIVRRLGMPPTVRELGGVRKDSFRWTCYDTLTGTFEAGYIVTPTFERGREYFAGDILVMFDARDVVSRISRTRTKDGAVEIVEWREVQNK